MPTPTLGKDCTFSGAGIDNTAVRSVTLNLTAREIESIPFGQRIVGHYPTGWDGTVEVELIADPNLAGNLQSGDEVTLSYGEWSGQAIVAGISRSEPLDDVVTWRVLLKPAVVV